MVKNIKPIAAALGAEIVGQVSKTGGRAFGTAQVAHERAKVTRRR